MDLPHQLCGKLVILKVVTWGSRLELSWHAGQVICLIRVRGDHVFNPSVLCDRPFLGNMACPESKSGGLKARKGRMLRQVGQRKAVDLSNAAQGKLRRSRELPNPGRGPWRIWGQAPKTGQRPGRNAEPAPRKTRPGVLQARAATKLAIRGTGGREAVWGQTARIPAIWQIGRYQQTERKELEGPEARCPIFS